jgi:hypothetical protein
MSFVLLYETEFLCNMQYISVIGMSGCERQKRVKSLRTVELRCISSIDDIGKVEARYSDRRIERTRSAFVLRRVPIHSDHGLRMRPYQLTWLQLIDLNRKLRK